MHPDEIKLRARIFVYARRRIPTRARAAIRRELLSADYTGRRSQRIVYSPRIERGTDAYSLSVLWSAVSYIEIIVTDREQCFLLLGRRALHKRDFLPPQVRAALLGVLRSLIITITPIFYGTNFSFLLAPCLAS